MCIVEGCERTDIHGHGYCRNHYARWRNHGDPLGGGPSLASPGAPMSFLKANIDYAGEDCLAWPFSRTPDGYAQVSRGRASRVMCELVNGPPPHPDMVAAHNCGKGHEGCVHPQHVRWATQSSNMADKRGHGTHQAGERHGMAKLTVEQVEEIRSLKGSVTQKTLALRFGVSVSLINQIHRGVIWRDMFKREVA